MYRLKSTKYTIITYRTPQKYELVKICSDYLGTMMDKKTEITNVIVDLLVKVQYSTVVR